MKINEISLRNFKSFEKITLELSNLNIFSGANSVGKSTAIQALLLLKQNELNITHTKALNILLRNKKNKNELTPLHRFDVNGQLVELGYENSLLYIDAIDDNMMLSVSSEHWKLEVYKEASKQWTLGIKSIKKAQEDNNWVRRAFMAEELVPSFQYLSTNRIEPKVTYPLSSNDIASGSIGIYGQFTAHYLAENKSDHLSIPELKHKKSRTEQLLENVSHWLAEISENIDVTAKVLHEANQAAITYNYTYGHSKSRDISPLNVGFGVTHVLPVVTLLLKAKKGDTLIIENPETHLHPSGQANLSRLISLVAAHGVQIIIETHSDHILNGVRVATKHEVISPEQSKVYFFQREEDSLATKATKINILEDGSVSEWPKGFFDEWDNQLDKLIW